MLVSARNAKLLADLPASNLKTCSCTKSKECPLDKKCHSKNIIYKANITQENGKNETYTGLTSTTFKAHKTSFKNPYVNQTSLSNHIKKLNKKIIAHTIKWDILSRAKPLSPVSEICSLCIYITFTPGGAT
jgi:hypothetical protein